MKYLFLMLIIPSTLFAQKDSLLYKMSAINFMKLVAVNMPIDARNPNNAVLDAALFHATNEQRIKFNIPIFVYSNQLHEATIGHSEAMINQDFYSHENLFNPVTKNMIDRIYLYTKKYRQMAENIAQHDILGGDDDKYCFEIPKRGQEFIFLNCDTKKIIPLRTYAELALSVVNGWMNSPHHRQNILDPKLKSMATSGRISKDAFKTQRSPFARLTQDFGG